MSSVIRKAIFSLLRGPFTFMASGSKGSLVWIDCEVWNSPV